ncbi:MAG: cold shock domain-containing protein [Opitutae bacterium]|nr:cold shock domain-containing protein [Opitutae bacterium]
MCKGVVKWFNRPKGFGFIELEKTGVDVFLHVSKIVDGDARAVAEGDQVEFDADQLSNGLRARNVRRLGLTPVAE